MLLKYTNCGLKIESPFWIAEALAFTLGCREGETVNVDRGVSG